jgi:hypothetical protein
MTTHTALQDKLFTWLNPIAQRVGINALIFTQQNGIEPAEDYIAVDIQSFSTDAPPEVLNYTSETDPLLIDEKTIYRSQIAIQLRVFSKTNSMGIAEEFKNRIFMTNSLEFMMKVNLGLHSVADTTNRSFVEAESNRARADIDLILHYTASYLDTISTIGKVDIIGYNADNGMEMVNISVEEPGYIS